MARDLILGTAGHIDHGKTSLVRALTGTDTDRLPEEKSRGITIDLGFASLDLGDIRFGIVDVPGHERFIRNMLAGATGIDVALLVVAADDSVMPQTREHLEILNFLGVRHGVVALTKCDLVDDEALEIAAMDVREALRGTLLEQSPIVPTSAPSGRGIAELRAALQAAGRAVPGVDAAGSFRMPIDRAFVLQGHGTVVTGSVISGSVRVQDELEWHAGGGTLERVRVRSLSNHGKPVEELHRGQRGAVNLAGVPLERVHRGQELASPGLLQPSRVLSIRLTPGSATHHRLRHRLPVRVHLGTAEAMGRLSLLTANELEPGQSGFAQLFLAEHVTGLWGQPVVLRDSAAEATLGGGAVLHPHAGKIRRRDAAAIAQLAELDSDDAARRVAAAAWFAGFRGVKPEALPREAGVPAAEASAILDTLLARGKLVAVPPLLHAEQLRELSDRIMKELAKLHAEQPLATRHDRARLAAQLDYIGNPALVDAVIQRLMSEHRIAGDKRRVARADFKPRLSANQMKLKDRIVGEVQAGGFAPPEPARFANLAGGSSKSIAEIFEVAEAEGDLVRITPEIFLHQEAVSALVAKVRDALSGSGGATVAEIKELLGTTRKYAVPICEYLDRAGVTRREGDVRKLA